MDRNRSPLDAIFLLCLRFSFSKKIQSLNFNQLQDAIKKYKLDTNKITEEDFYKNNILKKTKGLVKLLNVGKLNIPINIEISYASKKAIEKIKEFGGNIKTTKEN